MQALLVLLIYGGVLWLALMGLGYLRPRRAEAAADERPADVDGRSAHAILEAGLTLGAPASLDPEVRDRVFRNALAIAARKPHLLFAIGRVVAMLKPVTPEQIDAVIETTTASVEGVGVGPGADMAGAWHPLRVRAFLEALPGDGRVYVYLPTGWDGSWAFFAYSNTGSRRRPRASDLSLTSISLDAAAFDAAKPRAKSRDGEVDVMIEGREHIVDRIALHVEGDAGDVVRLRERVTIVAAAIAAGLFREPLPDGVLFAMRRGLEVQHDLANGRLTYTHRIDRPSPPEGDRCVATIELVRDGP